MPVMFTDQDLGFDSLRREMSKADGMAVETGLFIPKEATKGVYLEYGTRDMAARPWLSIAADTSVPTIEKVGARELRRFAPKQKFKPVLEDIGAEMAEHTKAVIRNGQVGGPPLKPSTVDKKGNAQKLLDTLAMYSAITYEVTREGAT